jgi:hypothetical protein
MDMEAALSDHGSGFRPGPFVVTLENEAYSARLYLLTLTRC